jgi:hypothetical protein
LIAHADALALCQKEGTGFCETSSKTGMNVENAVYELTRMIFERKEQGTLCLPEYKNTFGGNAPRRLN